MITEKTEVIEILKTIYNPISLKVTLKTLSYLDKLDETESIYEKISIILSQEQEMSRENLKLEILEIIFRDVENHLNSMGIYVDDKDNNKTLLFNLFIFVINLTEIDKYNFDDFSAILNNNSDTTDKFLQILNLYSDLNQLEVIEYISSVDSYFIEYINKILKPLKEDLELDELINVLILKDSVVKRLSNLNIERDYIDMYNTKDNLELDFSSLIELYKEDFENKLENEKDLIKFIIALLVISSDDDSDLDYFKEELDKLDFREDLNDEIINLIKTGILT